MVFDKILVATDGSEYAKRATKDAMELAKLSGGKVTGLYVIDRSTFVNIPRDAAVTDIYRTLEKEGEATLAAIKEIGDQYGVKVEVEVAVGSPVEVIVEKSKGFDLIVMGSLGRTGIAKILTGSVAERVVRYADCRVMVVKSCITDE